MRPLSQMAVQSRLRNGPLAAFGFFAFAILLAYKVAQYIITNDSESLAFAAMAFVGGAIVVAILNNWRHGVYLFFAWLLFEDLPRKYLSNNMAIYFAKDILVAVVYLSFFMACRRRDRDLETFRPPFFAALMIIVWFGALQMFNPASTSIFYGLLGMKLYFYYMPLVVLGYALMNSEADLRRFFHVNLGLMLIIVALGLVQAVLGHTFLNPENPAADIRELSTLYREAPISGVRVYRPTSVFVSAGRFSDMLIVMWMVVFGFSGYLLLRHRRGRIFAFLALGVTAAGALMGASRGVFMWTMGSAAVGSAAFVWGAPWREGEARRVVRTLFRAALGVVLAVAGLLVTYPEALLNRLAVYSETLDPRSPATELAFRATDYPLRNLMFAFSYPRWPYGYGIGSVSQGGQYVTRILHAPPATGGVESGFGNIIIELGIVGLLLWFVMTGAILFCSWRVVRRLRGSPWFPLGFMIFWYVALLLGPFTFVGLQAYQDFLLNAYAWVLLGVLFRLPKLALSAQFAAVPAMQPRFVSQPALEPGARWTS
jgi:hypothetical protein